MKHFKTLLLSCWALPGFHQFTQQAVEHHFRIEGPFLPLNWKTEETYSGHLDFVLKSEIDLPKKKKRKMSSTQ